MGEAARRRKQGFDGQRLGEAVLAALNEDAGGDVWENVKGMETPTEFLILNTEDFTAQAGIITNQVAGDTPHRLVAQALMRRGDAWVTALVFDPAEEYRQELYDALARRAFRVARSAGAEDVDEVRIEIIHSAWPESRGFVARSLAAAVLDPDA